MTETVDTREMARLLDEWADAPNPFVPDFQPSFGLSDEQRREPLVQAAAEFASFAFKGDGDKEAYAGPFVPMFGEAPARLDCIKNKHPEALGSWHDFSVYVEDRFLAAKLQDLLWIVRYADQQDPVQYARDAIENYLRFYDEALSRDFEHKQVHLYHLLLRVANLAKEINAADEFHPAISEHCQAWLLDSSENTYIWPIRVAAQLIEPHRPTDLHVYIRALHDSYASSEDQQRRTMRDGLFALELEMATTPEARSQLRDAAAEMFLEEAQRSSSPMFALAHLEEAAEWSHGAASESRLVREINAFRRTLDLSADLQEISAEVPIPEHEVRQLRERIIEPDDYRDGLTRLVASVASDLRDIDDLQDRLQKVRDEPRLLDLIPVKHIHRGGFECCSPATPEDRQRKELAGQHRMRAISIAKLWLEDSLDAIRVRYALEPSTLVEFVTQYGIVGQVEGEAFGRAFRHYWDGDYDSAASVALPRIESALRGIAVRAGISTISLPSDKCGVNLPLGAILPRLKEALGESEVKMLQLLLVDNHGMNLRDNYAHGIPSKDPQADAAITLWLALWLGFLRSGDE